MFDLSKIGDLSSLAAQARQFQENQERFQKEQMDLLRKIHKQLEEITLLLKARK